MEDNNQTVAMYICWYMGQIQSSVTLLETVTILSCMAICFQGVKRNLIAAAQRLIQSFCEGGCEGGCKGVGMVADFANLAIIISYL